MEKRGIIESGRTPPEDDDQKKASGESLEDHVTKRAADQAKDSTKEARDGDVTQHSK